MNCYLCNSKQFKKKNGTVRDQPTLNILECNNCNLVFLDNMEHISNDIYENSGMHGTDLLSIDTWLKETEKDDQRRINILKNEISNKSLNSDDALLSLYNSNFKDFTYWSKHLFLFNAKTLNILANQAGLKVLAVKQFQRYPLSNHLFWLSEGTPGGHVKWSF